MPSTYAPIQSFTLSSTASSVSFTGIPQTYTDLIVKVAQTNTTTSTLVYLRLNNATSGYPVTVINANGTTASSSRISSNASYFTGNGTNQTANTLASFEIYVSAYAGSTFKPFYIRAAQESNVSAKALTIIGGLFESTTAVTSLQVISGSTFAVGTTFHLYGIVAPSVAAAKGTGGEITSDGTYIYHTFRDSGTLALSSSVTADVLVVAGGGGGGGNSNGGARTGGGGGGGGVIYQTGVSLPATSYSIAIGSGGNGGVLSSGSNGNNTTFHTFTAIGGGRGSYAGGSAGNGGSGGGGGANDVRNGGLGTAGQGNDGGVGTSTWAQQGPGGGGAGSIGENKGSITSYGGNGGSSSSYFNQSVGGGGGGGGSSGGGLGGTGSGGNGGGTATSGSHGVFSTGGGGGGGGAGSSSTTAGGNGGSGIVIVRYPV